jgi:hypothetical protein
VSTAIALEDLDWSADARQAIETACRNTQPITAETLRDAGLREPPRPSMWGAAFRAARDAGLIHRVGYAIATRPERRGAVLAVWHPKTTLF